MNHDLLQMMKRNAGPMALAQAANWLCGLTLMLLLPRFLGSGEYGRLYLALSITALVEIFISFGGQHHVTKETARDPGGAGRVLADALAIRAALWLLSAMLLLVGVRLLEYPPAVLNLLFVFGAAQIWESASWVIRWCFHGFGLMVYPARAAIVDRVLLMLAGSGVLLAGGGTLAVAGVMAGCALVRFAYLAAAIRRRVPSIPRPCFASVAATVRTALPYFLWSVAAAVYYRIDAVMLSVLTPPPVVGWYGAAYRFFDVLMFLPSLFTTMLFPVISRSRMFDGNASALDTRRGLEAMLLAGVPISILTFAFAPAIIGTLFGTPEYASSVPLLRIFAVGMLFVYLDFILGSSVLAADKQRQWSLVAVTAIGINVGLNLAMIPFFQDRFMNGGIGAAIATLLTESFVFASAVALLPDRSRWMPRSGIVAKSMMAGAVMCGVVWIGSSATLIWPFIALAGVAMYLAALAVLQPLGPDGMRLFRTILGGRSGSGITDLERRGASSIS